MRFQKTSLDWRLQLAESKWPDGAGKALQLVIALGDILERNAGQVGGQKLAKGP